MPNPGQFDTTEQSGFTPPGYQPLRPSDIEKVKKSYGITAPRFARSASDKSVYDFAKKSVLDWWKKQQAPASTTPPAGGAPGSGSGGGGGGGGGGAGGGGYIAPGSPGKLPDPGYDIPGGTAKTYKPTVPGSPGKLPDPGYDIPGPGGRTVPVPPTTQQITAALKAAGHPEWKPPTYALASVADLNAWIARAKANLSASKKSSGTYAKKPVQGVNAGQPKTVVKRPVKRFSGVTR